MIAIPKEDFEWLLICLANQKYIHEVNADGISMGKEAVESIQQSMQKTIDECYHKNMKLLMSMNQAQDDTATPPLHQAMPVKAVKPIKAWAILNKNMEITPYWICTTKKKAEEYCLHDEETICEVLITPISQSKEEENRRPSICSAHQKYDFTCRICNPTVIVRELESQLAQKDAEIERLTNSVAHDVNYVNKILRIENDLLKLQLGKAVEALRTCEMSVHVYGDYMFDEKKVSDALASISAKEEK